MRGLTHLLALRYWKSFSLVEQWMNLLKFVMRDLSTFFTECVKTYLYSTYMVRSWLGTLNAIRLKWTTSARTGGLLPTAYNNQANQSWQYVAKDICQKFSIIINFFSRIRKFWSKILCFPDIRTIKCHWVKWWSYQSNTYLLTYRKWRMYLSEKAGP